MTSNKQLSISSWNVHGLGEKHKENLFKEKMKSDINVILETWKGENSQTQIDGFICISKSRKKHKKSRRHSGGIIVYIRKILFKGITYLSDATTSPNRLWIKLRDKVK